MSNVSSSSIAGRLGADSIATTKIAGGALPTDVTVTTANIVNNAVDFTKIQDIGHSTVIGRAVGSAGGNPAALTAAEVRSIINVENGATADQTAAEIRTLVESASDSNVFTDADHSKLNGIEASATADQTAAEIRALVASASDSQVFTDADHSKLDGIESGATADQSASEIKTLYESNSDTNVFTDDDHAKLAGIESNATADQTASEILTLIKTVDGSGSGLDADLIDGTSKESFLRSDTVDTANGDITFNGGSGAITVAANSDIRLTNGSWSGDNVGAKIQGHNSSLYLVYPDAGSCYIRDSAGNNNFTVDSSGNCTAVGNVTAYSDARLKTDIHTINDALGICGKLRGVSYKWIADNKPSIGVIAQEVEEVLPELVLTNQDVNPVTQEITEMKSVDYGKIVGVLINAINELKAEVDELKGGK
jgi:hypothetical protein